MEIRDPVFADAVAALNAGDNPVLKTLLAAGALTDLRDTIWHGAPSDWAGHAGHDGPARFLSSTR